LLQSGNGSVGAAPNAADALKGLGP
jgi:hypothetical protein